jgi:hypothetical protein
MSHYKRDLNKEQKLGIYLDTVYKKIDLKVTRVNDLNLQHKGVDLIYTHNANDIYIDEKAQLDYVNKNLPTFTFELSYLKDKTLKEGWLFDDNKQTHFYFLVTGIKAKNPKQHDYYDCIITSVDRSKLLRFLDGINLDEQQLSNYQKEIRARKHKENRIEIKELDIKKEGCLFFSPHLAEHPINLQLRLQFLIDSGIAKCIYPVKD